MSRITLQSLSITGLIRAHELGNHLRTINLKTEQLFSVETKDRSMEIWKERDNVLVCVCVCEREREKERERECERGDKI